MRPVVAVAVAAGLAWALRAERLPPLRWPRDWPFSEAPAQDGAGTAHSAPVVRFPPWPCPYPYLAGRTVLWGDLRAVAFVLSSR